VPWEHHARLIKEAEPGESGTGGIKNSKEKNWVFIAPDPGSPVFHIYAEGFDEEYAESMIDLYSGKIKSLIKDTGG
jgi:mannose-1-phosphate guanylyltransferase/phosphomannomutase